MAVVFAGSIPNSPQLPREAGSAAPSASFQAIKECEGELYCMKPDTLILLTAHGGQIPELINLNIATTFVDGTQTFHCDVELTAKIKESGDSKSQPMVLIAESHIPPEIDATLALLMTHLPQVKVVLLSTAQFSLAEHFQFGEFLRHECIASTRRIAVVASGHLAKYRDGAPDHHQQSLDSVFVKCVTEHQPEKILRLNPELQQASQADLLAPFATLLGVINHVNVKPAVLSYEQRYGAGLAVVNFILQ